MVIKTELNLHIYFDSKSDNHARHLQQHFWETTIHYGWGADTNRVKSAADRHKIKVTTPKQKYKTL